MARIVTLGASGTGKSHHAGKLLEEIVPKFDLAIHYDLENEEIGLSDADHDPIYKTLHVDPQMADRLDWVKVVANHRKIRVVPEDMTMAEQQELYAVLCSVIMQLCSNAKPEWTAFISCDEAHNLVTQTAFDSRVERMITGGRKHGVECLHISQRPQLLHTTVISQADRRVYFSINDDNDIGKIQKVSSFPGNALKDLPDRCCVVENKSTGDYKIVVTDPDYEQHIPSSLLTRFDIEIDDSERQHPHYSGDDGIADDAFPV